MKKNKKTKITKKKVSRKLLSCKIKNKGEEKDGTK